MFCDDRSCQFLISYCFLWSKLYSLTKGDFMIYVPPVTRDVLTCHAGVGEGQNNVLSWNQYLTTEMTRKWKVSAIRHLKTRNRSKVNSLYPPQKNCKNGQWPRGRSPTWPPRRGHWPFSLFFLSRIQTVDLGPVSCFVMTDRVSFWFPIHCLCQIWNPWQNIITPPPLARHARPRSRGTRDASGRHARRTRDVDCHT